LYPKKSANIFSVKNLDTMIKISVRAIDRKFKNLESLNDIGKINNDKKVE
tara:strand:+ start:584 stop:733 length:150 start_codon:yes stop_codon:yes gene_type:complete